MKILAINGSYRRGGMIDQAVEAAAAAARAGGAEVETVLLTEKKIEFCTNCRACTQAPGPGRGDCPLADDMPALLDAIDAADGLILAAPVNFFDATALFRRFLERLIPYAYWPWGAAAPKLRLKPGARKAVLITSAAMPAPIGRLFTGALKALGNAASAAGTKKAGTLFIGIAALAEKAELPAGDRRRAEALGRKLL